MRNQSGNVVVHCMSCVDSADWDGSLSVCISVGMFGFVCTFSVVDCSLVCQLDSQSICLIILCVVCVVVCLCLFVSVKIHNF